MTTETRREAGLKTAQAKVSAARIRHEAGRIVSKLEALRHEMSLIVAGHEDAHVAQALASTLDAIKELMQAGTTEIEREWTNAMQERYGETMSLRHRLEASLELERRVRAHEDPFTELDPHWGHVPRGGRR